MSLQQVMPPREHLGARDAACRRGTNSSTRGGLRAARCAPSSQACSGRSSAIPRISVIAACACRLTRPGHAARGRAGRPARAAHSRACASGAKAPARRCGRRRRPARGRSAHRAGSTGTIQRASITRSTACSAGHRADFTRGVIETERLTIGKQRTTREVTLDPARSRVRSRSSARTNVAGSPQADRAASVSSGPTCFHDSPRKQKAPPKRGFLSEDAAC